MPFAIVNRIIEEFNTNGISSVLRADNILDIQLSSAPGSTFALSNEQIAALKENQILPLEYSGGTVLAYRVSFTEDEWKVAHGTTPASPSASDLLTKYQSHAEYSADYTFSKMSVVTIAEAMEDGDFKNPYTTASKTWRGGNSGWYDELAALGENIHGYQRSRWFKYGAKSVSQGVTNVFQQIAKSSLSSSGNNTSISGGERTIEGQTTRTGDNGDTVTETTYTADGDVDGNDSTLIGQSKSQANIQLAAKFISMASTGTSVVCAGIEGLMGVQTLVSTYQRVQKLNLVSGYMESVQKIQVGDYDGSSMHEYNNRLTTADPETGKNAINAAGMGALFSGDDMDASDVSIIAVNTEKALSNVANDTDDSILKIFGSVVGNANAMLKAYEVCNYLQGGLAIANAVVTVLSVIPIIGQGIAAISLTAKGVITAAIKTAIGIAAPIIARKVVEYAGNLLIKDMATDWLGEDLGNAIVSGGNSLLSSNHQIGGGSPGSTAKVSAFRHEQQRIIAEEAEYQRSIRSPFDITSQHTFLGSVVYSLVPMANSAGAGATLKNIGSIITKSASSLLPSASAIAETSLVDDLAKPGDCPTLEVVGIQGDVYCNPIYITDKSTITEEYKPEDILAAEESWGYISRDSSGKITIKDNTSLTNYITYCGQRTSSFGIVDANIAKEIVSGGSSVGKTILSFIPIVSDAVSVVEAANKEKNLPWTTGSACVASETNEYWRENQIHQRFVEDQRLYADISGQTKDNPVVAYLNDYYDEHPLDNSYEGILARYSGMTKDDVIATLELIDGLTYLANYHPSERVDFLAVADGSFRTIPQGPAVGIINIHESSTGRLWAQIRLDVVIPTTAARGPVRKESFVTA